LHKHILDNVNIVLVEPQVPGNVGSAARAMKNMGLSRLTLVNPWFPDHLQARYMAHGSEDILDRAKRVSSVFEAVEGSVLIAATTRRKRHNTPFMYPKDAAYEIMKYAGAGTVSILFGREESGLTNEELKMCQLFISIQSSEKQPSLNLSQAVMVIAYEIFNCAVPEEKNEMDYARAEEIEIMFSHLKESLIKLGLREWNDGDNFMKSLRRVFSRTGLESRDVGSIHKLCSEIDKYAFRLRDEFSKGKKDG